MNNLSWLIYLADVLPALSAVAGVAGVLLSLALGVAPIPLFIEDAWDRFKGVYCKLWIVVAVFAAINVVCPSKETMYLIAASEMGEEVTMTPEFTKIRTIINSFLDDQIEGRTDDNAGGK